MNASQTRPICRRQIHLDFHTSPHIPGVGENFDPEKFAHTLKEARVESVTCFARCHHGYLYYDSKRHPERKHPHLKRNLLAEQIEVCHQYGIRVPIYTTVQWDDYTAQRHPEWLVRNEDGSPRNDRPDFPGFYRTLAVNSGYRDFLREHVMDLLETFPCDGLFFDIVNPKDDWSAFSQAQMRERGLDPQEAQDRYRFGVEVIHEWMKEMSSLIRSCRPEATIFYNSGHIGPRQRAVVDAYSHFEVESLASGGWGYLHMPLTARYVRHLDRKAIGMTGKFHTSWGDFHSYKNPAALEFECHHMAALGMGCSIGDQLHPNGELCRYTYQLIGSVYQQLERKEPWCQEARAVTEIGVLTPEEYQNTRVHSDVTGAIQGVIRMLQECGYQFDVIDSQTAFDVNKYRLLLMPDEIPVNRFLADKLDRYLDAGGSILISHKAGLDASGRQFALSRFGVTYVSDSPYCPDYLVPARPFSDKLSATEYVMYLRGAKVQARPGSEILAHVKKPYFNREGEMYCSHLHAPADGMTDYPAAVQNGNVIYLAHPVFSTYHEYAPRWCKTIVEMSLDRLLGRRRVLHNGPSTALVMLNRQDRHHRYVLHVLHFVPERRGKRFDVIEDVIPLYSVSFSVEVPESVTSVRLVPQMEAVEYVVRDGRIEFTVPRIDGHQMVEIQFSG